MPVARLAGSFRITAMFTAFTAILGCASAVKIDGVHRELPAKPDTSSVYILWPEVYSYYRMIRVPQVLAELPNNVVLVGEVRVDGSGGMPDAMKELVKTARSLGGDILVAESAPQIQGDVIYIPDQYEPGVMMPDGRMVGGGWRGGTIDTRKLKWKLSVYAAADGCVKVTDWLLVQLQERDSVTGAELYNRLVATDEDLLVGEWDVNMLGYRLIGQGRTDAAVAVLAFNWYMFPASYNVHDSLSDAYIARGDLAKAREFFLSAYELWPDYPTYESNRDTLGIEQADLDEMVGREPPQGAKPEPNEHLH